MSLLKDTALQFQQDFTDAAHGAAERIDIELHSSKVRDGGGEELSCIELRFIHPDYPSVLKLFLTLSAADPRCVKVLRAHGWTTVVANQSQYQDCADDKQREMLVELCAQTVLQSFQSSSAKVNVLKRHGLLTK